jgi:hypothetical protein
VADAPLILTFFPDGGEGTRLGARDSGLRGKYGPFREDGPFAKDAALARRKTAYALATSTATARSMGWMHQFQR